MKYIRVCWAFLMQMGAGYLNISCPVEALTSKKYASIIFPNGIAIFEISMSKKQAKQVSQILGRVVTIE